MQASFSRDSDSLNDELGLDHVEEISPFLPPAALGHSLYHGKLRQQKPCFVLFLILEPSTP